MAKKEAKPKVRCFDCANAELMQWDKNPVIAKCPYLLYRQVANSFRYCTNYQKSSSTKKITKLTHLK